MRKFSVFLLVFLIVSLSFSLTVFTSTVQASPAYEDFTTYTEVDPNNHIGLVGTDHIDHDAYRDEDAYLYKNFTSNPFDDFTHQVDVTPVSYQDDYCYGHPWVLANSTDDVYGLSGETFILIQIGKYGATVSNPRIILKERYGVTWYNNISDVADWNQTLYFTISKSGTSLTLKIYNNTARTDLLDTRTLTLHGDWKFKYIYPCNTYNNAVADKRLTYDVENLALQDETKPRYESSAHSTTEAGTSCTFNCTNVEDDIGLSHWVFSWNGTDSWTNSTWHTFSSNPENISETKTLPSQAGKVVGYKFYFNDTSNNWNYTSGYYLTTQDTTIPSYSNVQTNSTQKGAPALFSVDWSDNTELDTCLFTWNGTGSWTANETIWTNAGVGSKNGNITKTLPSDKDVRVEYRFYCNDTNGLWGDTGVQYIITSIDIAVVTDDKAIDTPYQRKGFYCSGRYWVFYSDGTNLVYKSSTDGVDWSGSATVLMAGDDGGDIDVECDGTNVYVAAINSTNYVFYRRGAPQSDGTISWSDDWSLIMEGSEVSISADSDGYPWVAIEYYPDADGSIVAVKSTNKTRWENATGFPYEIQTRQGSGAVVSMLNGKMCALSADLGLTYHNLTAHVWNGSDWESPVTVTEELIGWQYYSVCSVNDVVHVAWTTTSAYNLTYKQYNGTSWQSEETIYSSVTSSTAVVLGVDRYNGTLFAFYAGQPTAKHIYYKKRYSNGTWTSATDWIHDDQGLNSDNKITCYPHGYKGNLGVLWLAKQSSPYVIRGEFIIVTKAEKTFTVSATLSITTFSAEYQERLFYSTQTISITTALKLIKESIFNLAQSPNSFSGLNWGKEGFFSFSNSPTTTSIINWLKETLFSLTQSLSVTTATTLLTEKLWQLQQNINSLSSLSWAKENLFTLSTTTQSTWTLKLLQEKMYGLTATTLIETAKTFNKEMMAFIQEITETLNPATTLTMLQEKMFSPAVATAVDSARSFAKEIVSFIHEIAEAVQPSIVAKVLEEKLWRQTGSVIVESIKSFGKGAGFLIFEKWETVNIPASMNKIITSVIPSAVPSVATGIGIAIIAYVFAIFAIVLVLTRRE